jgi:hypothetical protein
VPTTRRPSDSDASSLQGQPEIDAAHEGAVRRESRYPHRQGDAASDQAPGQATPASATATPNTQWCIRVLILSLYDILATSNGYPYYCVTQIRRQCLSQIRRARRFLFASSTIECPTRRTYRTANTDKG